MWFNIPNFQQDVYETGFDVDFDQNLIALSFQIQISSSQNQSPEASLFYFTPSETQKEGVVVFNQMGEIQWVKICSKCYNQFVTSILFINDTLNYVMKTEKNQFGLIEFNKFNGDEISDQIINFQDNPAIDYEVLYLDLQYDKKYNQKKYILAGVKGQDGQKLNMLEEARVITIDQTILNGTKVSHLVTNTSLSPQLKTNQLFIGQKHIYLSSTMMQELSPLPHVWVILNKTNMTQYQKISYTSNQENLIKKSLISTDEKFLINICTLYESNNGVQLKLQYYENQTSYLRTVLFSNGYGFDNFMAESVSSQEIIFYAYRSSQSYYSQLFKYNFYQ
ncbi:UNKNOWN [Stylonychia lemnae]|uniref:Uncharacterized protein n=1 Tax=Stylonychia lemnae TaxID=5949 RepID=A0A078B9Q6_STYLE|nr:UNKNOWN [Stylonychia lemnae]|eukprot:CDW90921.1 UNKNOWN [Stylonychia lemnae]